MSTALPILIAGISHGADVYTEARIGQVETHDNHIAVYVDYVSGEIPFTGNGMTNEPDPNKKMLFLATSPSDIVNRKHFLATALAAQSTGALVRFRWDNTTSRVVAMLVRQ